MIFPPSDTTLGRHAGIPECCIRFFCSKDFDRNLPRLNRRRGGFAGVQYVMCTRCLCRYRRGLLVPARIHMCEDVYASPLCAFHVLRRQGLSFRDAQDFMSYYLGISSCNSKYPRESSYYALREFSPR